MKRMLVILMLVIFSFCQNGQTSTTRYEGLIGADDLNFATGGTGAAETFDRRTSTGGLLTQDKIDATNLKFRSNLTGGPYSVEDLVNGTAGWKILTNKPIITVGDSGYTTVAIAVAALNTAGTNVTLFIPNSINETLSASLVANSNIEIYPMKGCNITLGAYNFTINNLSEATGRYKWITKNSTGNLLFGAGALTKVFPEWWTANAVPGTTDMTTAIAAAATSVQSIYATADDGSPITLCLYSERYLTSAALDLTGINIDCWGRINSSYDGGSAVTVGQGSNLWIRLTVAKGTRTWDAGGVGIEVRDLDDSKLYLSARNYETGIKINAPAGENIYNCEFHFGQVYRNKLGIDITNAGTGWITTNQYHGGHISNDVAASTGAVRINSTGTIDIDSQNFYSPSIQYTSGVNGFIFDESYTCTANDVRIEGTAGSVVAQFRGYCQDNVVNISSEERSKFFAVDYSTDLCNGFGNKVNFINHRKVKLNQVSSTEHAYQTGTAIRIPGFEFIRINAALAETGNNTTAGTGIVVKPRGISERLAKFDLPSFGGFAVGNKVVFPSQLVPMQRLDLQATCVNVPYFYLRVYNAAGVELSGTAPYYVQGHSITSIGTYYRVLGNGPVYLDSTAKTVYVGIGNANGVTDFSIYGYATDRDDYGVMPYATVGYTAPIEMPGQYLGSASPTTWPLARGAQVRNTAATTGAAEGWVQYRTDAGLTLTADSAATDTTIDVSSAAGIQNGDVIHVLLDSGEYHSTTVNGAPAANVVTLLAGIPAGKNASTGNSVINCLWTALPNLP